MNSAAPKCSEDAASWPASIRLDLQQRDQRTRLVACEHVGPLYVQKPFYPEGEDCPHIYILHPPGGLVSGDCLDITVDVGEGASGLLTTPGAARAYRAREDSSVQRQLNRFNVAAGASVEWFPLETIVFSGAHLRAETHIELGEDATCAAWEVTSFGLPASGETFARGSFEQRYSVSQQGRPLFLDRLQVNDHNRNLLQASAGFRAEPVSGFFLMGPFSDRPGEQVMANLRMEIEAMALSPFASISLVGDLVVGRYLGDSAETARGLFSKWWSELRPLLINRPACPPRIWAT